MALQYLRYVKQGSERREEHIGVCSTPLKIGSYLPPVLGAKTDPDLGAKRGSFWPFRWPWTQVRQRGILGVWLMASGGDVMLYPARSEGGSQETVHVLTGMSLYIYSILCSYAAE